MGCKARVVVQIFLVKNSIYSNNNSAHLFVEDILSTVANVNNSIPENNEGMLTEYNLEQQRAVNNRTIKAFTCYCGKTCNGLLGLRARQTSCHISNIDELNIHLLQRTTLHKIMNTASLRKMMTFNGKKVTVKDGIKQQKTVD